jgi:hypothetical protein
MLLGSCHHFPWKAGAAVGSGACHWQGVTPHKGHTWAAVQVLLLPWALSMQAPLLRRHELRWAAALPLLPEALSARSWLRLQTS